MDPWRQFGDWERSWTGRPVAFMAATLGATTVVAWAAIVYLWKSGQSIEEDGEWTYLAAGTILTVVVAIIHAWNVWKGRAVMYRRIFQGVRASDAAEVLEKGLPREMSPEVRTSRTVRVIGTLTGKEETLTLPLIEGIRFTIIIRPRPGGTRQCVVMVYSSKRRREAIREVLDRVGSVIDASIDGGE